MLGIISSGFHEIVLIKYRYTTCYLSITTNNNYSKFLLTLQLEFLEIQLICNLDLKLEMQTKRGTRAKNSLKNVLRKLMRKSNRNVNNGEWKLLLEWKNLRTSVVLPKSTNLGKPNFQVTFDSFIKQLILILNRPTICT